MKTSGKDQYPDSNEKDAAEILPERSQDSKKPQERKQVGYDTPSKRQNQEDPDGIDSGDFKRNEQPDNPEEQPDVPSEEPVKPAEQPEKPTEKPIEPAERPVQPSEKPDTWKDPDPTREGKRIEPYAGASNAPNNQ